MGKEKHKQFLQIEILQKENECIKTIFEKDYLKLNKKLK